MNLWCFIIFSSIFSYLTQDRLHYEKTGVRVICICPDAVDTELLNYGPSECYFYEEIEPLLRAAIRHSYVSVCFQYYLLSYSVHVSEWTLTQFELVTCKIFLSE